MLFAAADRKREGTGCCDMLAMASAHLSAPPCAARDGREEETENGHREEETENVSQDAEMRQRTSRPKQNLLQQFWFRGKTVRSIDILSNNLLNGILSVS
jgi:hypothetical protein